MSNPSDSTGPAEMLNYNNPTHGTVAITRERLLAGRSCIVLGSLLILISTCVGLASVPAMMDGPGAPLIVGMLMLLMFAVLMGSGITYIVGGVRIRRGGTISVIVCLVLASLQLLFSLFVVVAGSITVLMGGGSRDAIGLGIYALAAAAFGQLVYFLVKILRQPRVPM